MAEAGAAPSLSLEDAIGAVLTSRDETAVNEKKVGDEHIVHDEVDISCWDWLSAAPAELNEELVPERALIESATAFDDQSLSEKHKVLVETLHLRLVGRPFTEPTPIAAADGDEDDEDDEGSEPRYPPGSGWEAIGFQRAASYHTDLRATGMLGPLATLYLVERYPALAKHLLSLAGGDDSPDAAPSPLEWPFMVVSLNILLHAITALKTGRLNKACNAASKEGIDRPVLTTLFDFYCAGFYAFGKSWAKYRRKTKEGDVRAHEFVGSVLQQYSQKKGLKNAEKVIAKFRRKMSKPPFAPVQAVGKAAVTDAMDAPNDESSTS